jgi:hypothetical protein
MFRQHKFAAALIATGLSGCGLSVPEISELWDQDRPADPAHGTPTLTATAQIEFEIKQKIYCELRYAVQQAELIKVEANQAFIPLGWGVQMQLSLGVDETVSLNPGVTFTQLLPNVMKIFGVFPNNSLNSVPVAQSFGLGFGANLSSDAMRTDKFNTYYSVSDLMKPSTLCQNDGKVDPQRDPFIRNLKWTPAASSPLLIESSLGLKDWLIGAQYVNLQLPSSSPQPPPASNPGNSGGKFAGNFELKGPLQGNGTFSGTTSSGGSPSGAGKSASSGSKPSSGDSAPVGATGQDSFSQEIKFIIVSTGNITPTWKLIQLSANTGNGSFFSTGRTRTHDLIITIGPPTQRTVNDFLATQIGEAVRNGVAAGALQ